MDHRIVKFTPDARADQAIQEFELADLRKKSQSGFFTTPTMRIPGRDVELPQKDSRFHFDGLVEPYVVKEKDPEIDIQRMVNERLEELRSEAEKAGREEGYNAGHAVGQKEGKDEVLMLAKAQLERMSIFIDSVEKSKDEIFAANEEILNRIALTICSSILERELKSDPEYLKNRIRKLIQEYGAKEVLKIRVSPERYDEILAITPEFQAKFETLKNLSVIPDGFMDGNDFILETDFHRIDASIENQLAAFRKEILGEAPASGSGSPENA